MIDIEYDRIELRDGSRFNRLYGVIVGGTALILKHGQTWTTFDLPATFATGRGVFIERVLHPDEEEQVAYSLE